MANRLTQVVRSLLEANRSPGMRALDLRASADLRCVNMMCEKVGETCLCRLSMCLERMRHLQHLDLRGNNLNRLPEVWSLPNLETLDVRENSLESLPEELASMKSLRLLRVDGNPLKIVPPSLARFINAGSSDSHSSGAASD